MYTSISIKAKVIPEGHQPSSLIFMSLLSRDKWVQYHFMTAMEKMGIMATSCSIHKVTAMAIETRLHSSRMHTAHLLPASPSMHCSRGVSAAIGDPLCGECLLEGGCLLPGGVSAPGRRFVSQHALRQTPPMNRITDTCKNMTLPQFHCGQ